jgi:uncharacterized protein (DUF1501 family)
MSDTVLVVIFLRGGADALALAAPTADPAYIAARPPSLRTLRDGDSPGLPLGDALADADFRLHPAAAPLHDLFTAGDLSLIHATGLREATRSHFDAEARIERGSAHGAEGGWLGRALARLPSGAPLPALAVGTALPESLRGSPAAVAPGFSDLTLTPGHWLAPGLRARLAAGFGAHPTLGATTQDLLALSDLLMDRHWDESLWDLRPYAPSVDYPEDTDLSYPLRTVAQAIKSDLGLRIATVDYGGWDTHAWQEGTFTALTSGLSRALMAFWRDLGPRQQDVAVVVQSEFGRRLHANASQGTDHGRAGLMMVLGPQSRGGRLLGHWPGLGHDTLEDGADLAVTTDYRDVLTDLLTHHLRITQAASLFPGLSPRSPGLFA